MPYNVGLSEPPYTTDSVWRQVLGTMDQMTFVPRAGWPYYGIVTNIGGVALANCFAQEISAKTALNLGAAGLVTELSKLAF
jgi:hypothetical protein